MSDDIPSIVEFSVDLSKQEQPPPLPPADYLGTIREVEVKMSQRDTRYAAIAFHIGADQYPADFEDGNPDGTTIIYRRVSLEDNPNARFGCRRFIEAIGGKLSKKVDTSEWVGMECIVEVDTSEYEGVQRPEIKKIREA